MTTWIIFFILVKGNLYQGFLMSISYAQDQLKSKYRVTLELDVQEDFNPYNIDWSKTLDVLPNEKLKVYVEDLNLPDVW